MSSRNALEFENMIFSEFNNHFGPQIWTNFKITSSYSLNYNCRFHEKINKTHDNRTDKDIFFNKTVNIPEDVGLLHLDNIYTYRDFLLDRC